MDLRTTAEERELIDRAVAVAGTDLTDFVVTHAYEAAQLAQASSTAEAVAGMAARFAAGDDALAGIIRERQDAEAQWRQLDGALVQASAQPPAQRDAAGEAAMRAKL